MCGAVRLPGGRFRPQATRQHLYFSASSERLRENQSVSHAEHTALTRHVPLSPLLDGIADGTLSLHTVIDDFCNRIEFVDPVVQALLPEEGRRSRLHAEASILEAGREADAPLPPLYGALVGIKDIIHIDGFVTRAGSSVEPNAFAGPESDVVTRLRRAGSLIAGKTVTTEFAYFEPGATRNPHNPAHTPGGSSSGSAAGVAAGMIPLAVGTQTIGSVIRPAAFCGVVGYKPSLGRIPSSGIVYFSPTIDHIGLFTQDVAGMTRAAAALCDGWDASKAAIERPRLGIPVGPYLAQADADSLDALEAAAQRAEDAGLTVQRVAIFEDIAEINQWHRRMVFAEFARQHARMYAQYGPLYRPRTAEIIAIGNTVSDSELNECRERCLLLRRRVENRMDAHGIDFWICPPAPGPAPQGLHATGDPNMNLPWTAAGMPAITVPAGFFASGLPRGLQIVARFGADESLLHFAVEVG